MKSKTIHVSLRYLIAMSVVVGGVVGILFATTRSASAACVAPSTSYGSATMQLAVSTAGTYRLWTRMNVPDVDNNSIMMEVDGGACYILGDTSNIPANTWTWVNHQNGDSSSTLTTQLSAGTHTIKVIGVEPNVMIDRVLAVADQACRPVNLGDNCMAVADTTAPTVAISAPTDGSTVAGVVGIKATVRDNTAVGKAEFYVQNQLINTDTAAPYEYSWDTTGKNGAYTITVKAYDTAGNVGSDTLAVVVQNGDNKAPTAPTGLTGDATAYNSVNLSWRPSTDDVALKGYRIVRNDTVIATTTSTSYTDSTVVAGTAYKYYIVAFDESNNASAPSSSVNVMTPNPVVADTQAPTPPTDVSATVAAANQVNIAWRASTDNTGVKEYDIFRARGSDTPQKIASVTATNYGDGSLSAGTTYRYYVIARDAAGNSSVASETVSIATPSAAETPAKSVLRGTVHGRYGRPLAGARVTLWFNGQRYTATTNWRGRYVIPNIPPGRYDVSVRADGYQRSARTITLREDKTKWYDVNLRRR